MCEEAGEAAHVALCVVRVPRGGDERHVHAPLEEERDEACEFGVGEVFAVGVQRAVAVKGDQAQLRGGERGGGGS